MLQIKNLTITHKKDLKTIVDNFQLVINPGDKAVIIGEEGNGKSTLLKWIYDPSLIEDYTESVGECICSRERLAYLPQELPREIYEKSVYEFFNEEPMFWEQTPKQLKLLANQLQLSEEFFYKEQKMRTLSGGERIKAQMARILITNPTILLLDEPSNDIDIPTLQWLEKIIVETEHAVVFISHDETLIEKTANIVIHLEQIRRKTVSRYTVSNLTYMEYMEQRYAAMVNQRQDALNERREEKIRQEKFRRIQQRVEHEQNIISRQDPHGGRLLKKKMKAVKSLEKRYKREAEDMTQMPEAEEAILVKFNDNIKIPAGKKVLDFSLSHLMVPNIEGQEEGQERKILSKNIHLQIRGNEKVCIIGKNGVGKSTLIRMIADELLEREDINAAYMPQNYEEQLAMEATPVEYLVTTGNKEEVTKIRTYLGSMKYTADEMNRPIAELSGGQKAKIFLLKMNLQGANVLILDEPTRNFSPLSNPVIREVLSTFGGAIISVSHDRRYITEVCDRVYELTEDGIVEIRKEGIIQ